MRFTDTSRDPSGPARRTLLLRAALLLPAAGAGVWTWRQSATPRIEVPPQAVPDPNGYALLVEGAAKMVRTQEVDRFFHPAEGPGAPPPPSRAQVRELLADNAECLRALRTALTLPAVAPHRGSDATQFAEFLPFRKAARLFVLDARAKAADGDFAAAAMACLDAIELGHRVCSGTVLIGRLVGIACQGIGRKPLWGYVEHLDGPGARTAALRLEAIHAARVPFAETLQEERYFGLKAWKESFADPARLAKEVRAMGDTGDLDFDPEAEPTPGEVTRTRLLLLRYGKANLVRAYDRHMAELVRRARLPYSEAERMPPIPEPADPFNSLTVPVFEGARHQDVAASEVQDALLAARMAVRAYRVERGAPPERLEEVVAAGCLRRVPADPFSPDGSAPLRYRRTENIPILYSVGPDGADDGGRPIENTASVEGEAIGPDSPLRRSVHRSSRGDVVAGVNLH